MKNIVLIVFCISLFYGCNTKQSKKESMTDSKAVKVELKNNNGQFQIYVNNEPFYIKGAGLEFGNIASVAKHGGNSFRTWRTENGQQSGKEVLDAAAETNKNVKRALNCEKQIYQTYLINVGYHFDDQETKLFYLNLYL